MENFGKFILFERLAAGGMAEVYLSKSFGAGGVSKFVAIKRILPQYSGHREFIDMFKEEAKIAVNLNHGNVVSIHDFGVEKNQFFLVMEYVEGRNLRQILNEFKKMSIQFSIEQAVFIIKEAAAGLDYAHRCVDGATGRPLNIVHRDMSPQNIMVSFEGGVKIIDFGIAKAETQLEATKAGTLKGKYGYMSPEQADGQNIDSRTDIFSVGIVLWELLANDRLFAGTSESSILRKLRECAVPSIRKINPSVPPELEAIVNKALSKDRNMRYQSAAALNRDLNRFLNTQFPEFSQNDFSVFIKKAFTVSFLEQRAKLVEYSKIQSAPSAPTTSVNEASYNSPPKPSAVGPNTHTSTDLDNKINDNLEFDSSASFETNLDGLESARQRRPNLSGATRNTDFATGVFSLNRSKIDANKKHRLMTNESSKIGKTVRFSVRFAKATLNSTVFVGIVGMISFGSWFAYIKYLAPNHVETHSDNSSNQPNPAIQPAPEPRPPNPVTPVEQLQVIQSEHIVQIRSNPMHSRVVINGEDTGEFTPMRKSLSANVPISIRLVKEGYSDYVTTYTPTVDAGEIDGTLQKLARTANLYVKLINAGANPELQISGIPIEIKPESEPYFIQAGINIKIRVINKLTGLSAEKIVMIPANQKETVELFLK
jgi:serine/threonine-protein kinase